MTETPRNAGSGAPLGTSAFAIGEAPELEPDAADADRRIHHPRISVMMPTRGRTDLLTRAVDSVLAQDYDDWELVVQESAATSRIALPDDPRIVHLVAEDRNISHGINLAMARASGDVLHYMCDDDTMATGCLTRVAASLGDAMWLRGLVEFVDPDGTALFVGGGRPWNLDRLKRRGNWVYQPAVFWRREAARAIGEFDEAVPLASDYDYWIRLGERWEPRSIDVVLAHYTVHRDSASRTQTREQYRHLERIARRYRSGRLAKLSTPVMRVRVRAGQLAREVVARAFGRRRARRAGA